MVTRGNGGKVLGLLLGCAKEKDALEPNGLPGRQGRETRSVEAPTQDKQHIVTQSPFTHPRHTPSPLTQSPLTQVTPLTPHTVTPHLSPRSHSLTPHTVTPHPGHTPHLTHSHPSPRSHPSPHTQSPLTQVTPLTSHTVTPHPDHTPYPTHSHPSPSPLLPPRHLVCPEADADAQVVAPNHLDQAGVLGVSQTEPLEVCRHLQPKGTHLLQLAHYLGGNTLLAIVAGRVVHLLRCVRVGDVRVNA